MNPYTFHVDAYNVLRKDRAQLEAIDEPRSFGVLELLLTHMVQLRSHAEAGASPESVTAAFLLLCDHNGVEPCDHPNADKRADGLWYCGHCGSAVADPTSSTGPSGQGDRDQ